LSSPCIFRFISLFCPWPIHLISMGHYHFLSLLLISPWEFLTSYSPWRFFNISWNLKQISCDMFFVKNNASISKSFIESTLYHVKVLKIKIHFFSNKVIIKSSHRMHISWGVLLGYICDNVIGCLLVVHNMHNTFKNTKCHPLKVEGHGAMVCLYTIHYDFKNFFIKYLCHLFLFCCH
jgi:hypothetical protein